MNNRQLSYFCSVADEKSFSKAAEKLYLSQQALSKTIDRLEEELEVPLFIRTAQGLELTEYGKHLRKSAVPYLQLHQSILDQIRELRHHQENKLTLGYPTGMLVNFPDDFLSRFIFEHPEADIRIISYPDDSYNRSLQQADIDIHFCSTLNAPSLLNIEFFYHHPIFALLSKNHPLAQKKTLTLHDLEGQRFVSINVDTALTTQQKRVSENHGILPSVVFSPSEMPQIFSLIAHCNYVSFFGSTSIPLPNQIVKREILDMDLEYEFYIVTHKNTVKTKLMKEFIQYTKSFFNNGDNTAVQSQAPAKAR